MHTTESLGIAYEWVEWDLSCIEHKYSGPLDRLFGYAALAGAMSNAGEGPFGLSRIRAHNRTFVTKSQQQMQEMIYHRFCPDESSLEDWITQLQTSAALREKLVEAMQQDGILPQAPPWQSTTP